MYYRKTIERNKQEINNKKKLGKVIILLSTN